jgi:hypothetical protein
MTTPKVFADFHNSDPNGRVRLNTVGSAQDLSRIGTTLTSGLKLLLYCDELEVEGEAVHSPEEGIWVAKIDWSAVRKRG